MYVQSELCKANNENGAILMLMCQKNVPLPNLQRGIVQSSLVVHPFHFSFGFGFAVTAP